MLRYSRRFFRLRKHQSLMREEHVPKMAEYMASNGQTVTDEMIDKWCEHYDKGEFPPGEHTVGALVPGRPLAPGPASPTLDTASPISNA